MATVCGGSLALMNAGVPMKAPVSGIAMGLVKEGDDFVVLTDIAGYEDHFGDMDFKVAGTRKGITAVQLDIKIDGLNDAIIDKTLEQARQARLHILDKMHEAICEPAGTLSEYAPVITTIQINREKIKDLIGPGGKTIKELVATFDVKINTEDDGKVSIAAATQELAQQVIERIRELTQGVEIGKLYTGKISRIEEYGVFVELFRGSVGLVHISELSDERVRNITDLNLNIGDPMEVRVIDVDRDNRIRVSRRAVQDEGFRPPPPRPRPQRR
jgi:polyribonucleotide nucleotidyltransferase